MKKSKELLLIRYIVLLILLGQIFVGEGKSSIISTVFLLGLVINNQLRIFYLKNDYIMYLSIIAECIIVAVAHNYFGGNILLYLLGIIIDLFSLKRSFKNYIALGIVFFLVVNKTFTVSEIDGFTNMIILVVMYILLSYIERLYRTKVEAQVLYDKLRISEEKLKEANDELERYAASIEEIAVLRERNRISREIHDSVGHALSTTMIQLSAMERFGEKDNNPLGEMAGTLREFVNESFQDVKRAVRELKPDEYENYEGVIRIIEACKNFEKLSGVKIKINTSKEKWILSTKQSQNLYRITQEILSNALRHGKATVINIVMNYLEDEMVMSFRDNGIGTSEIIQSGVGLKSIRERVRELNGTTYMSSEKGEGFFVKVTFPKEKEI